MPAKSDTTICKLSFEIYVQIVLFYRAVLFQRNPPHTFLRYTHLSCLDQAHIESVISPKRCGKNVTQMFKRQAEMEIFCNAASRSFFV